MHALQWNTYSIFHTGLLLKTGETFERHILWLSPEKVTTVALELRRQHLTQYFVQPVLAKDESSASLGQLVRQCLCNQILTHLSRNRSTTGLVPRRQEETAWQLSEFKLLLPLPESGQYQRCHMTIANQIVSYIETS